MLKNKTIQCVTCGKVCQSGKRKMCRVCYNKYLKQKQKDKNQREKKRNIYLNNKEKKSISKNKLLQLIQKLVRLCTPDYCCTCNSACSSGDKTRMKTGGHFVSARKATTAYLVINIHQQCSHCNSDQSTAGKMLDHAKYIDNLYQEGLSDWLWAVSKIAYHFSRPDLIELRNQTLLFLNKAEQLTSLKEKMNLLKEYQQWQENTTWYKEISNLVPKNSIL